MGVYSIKPAFQRMLGPIEGFLVRNRVHPDWITGSALVLSVGGGLLFYVSDWSRWLLLAIPAVTIGRLALNALDGLVAAKTGVARPWGEVLNEFSDRLSDMALLAGVSLAPGTSFPLGMATVILVLLSSYLGTVARAAGMASRSSTNTPSGVAMPWSRRTSFPSCSKSSTCASLPRRAEFRAVA